MKSNNFLGYKNGKVSSTYFGKSGGWLSIFLGHKKSNSSGNRQGSYKQYKKSGGRKNKGLFF